MKDKAAIADTGVLRITKILKDNIVVLFFLVFTIFMVINAGSPMVSWGLDASSRFFRNILLITALILPIMSGVGLNFGITLGAMAAQLALVLIMILQIDNQPLSIVYWAVLTVIISIVCGKLLALLFNKTKGHEMIAGLLVGFFANGIYEFLLMVLCGDILKIDVNGLVVKKGEAIKATVSVSDGLTGVLDNAFPIAYYYIAYLILIIAVVYFLGKLVWTVLKGDTGQKKAQAVQTVAGIVISTAIFIFCMYNEGVKRFLLKVNFPFVTAVISLLVILAVRRIMRSKLGHDFISVRNDMHIAASVGINVDKSRTMSIILSTIIAGLGEMFYIQNLGTMNTYIMHNTVAIYAIAAILIGGATVRSANIKNVLIGNILFQIIYTCAPNAAKALMGSSQIGEYFRVFFCYAIIAFAIVSNAIKETNAANKKARGI
ncbi:MAG: ABC transporter permease subunit [Candidatus Pararuminococcus gallinarum]|jgi:simple sugar transport system permease protein